MLILFIRDIDENKLRFGFYTGNPTARINQMKFDMNFTLPWLEILGSEIAEISIALRSSDSKLIHQKIRLATKIIVPESVLEILRVLRASEKFLYLDLDEKLDIFPWETILVGTDTPLYMSYFIGRGFRQNVLDSPAKTSKNEEFVVIANPDHTLPASTKEAVALRSILSPSWRVTTFSHMLCDEFFPAIEGVFGLHFSGHSDGFSLTLSDGKIKGLDIATNGFAPSFVFLNSCAAGKSSIDTCNDKSLISAFMQVGTKNLIAPFEIIDDESAALFSAAFFRGVTQENLTIGESIAMARNIPVLKNRILVPFVLYGSPYVKLPELKSIDLPAPPVKALAITKNAPDHKKALPSAVISEKPKVRDRSFGDLIVLIVEPSVVVAGLIKDILINLGVKKSIRISSSRESIRYIHSNSVDLVICGCELSDGSGYDLLMTVRSGNAKAGTPFIMLGTSDMDEITYAAVWEIDGYLIKPILPEKATSQLKNSLQAIYNPNSYNVMITSALKSLDAENYEEAFSLIEGAIEKYPGRPRALVHKADILAKMGKLEDSVECLRLSILKCPQFFKAYEALGNILLRKGYLEEALNYFVQELNFYPKLFQKQLTRRMQIAELLIKCNRYAESLTHLEAAKKADRNSIPLNNLLITVYTKLGKIDEALKCLGQGKPADNEFEKIAKIAEMAARRDKGEVLFQYLKTARIRFKKTAGYDHLLAHVYHAFNLKIEALNIFKHLDSDKLDPLVSLVEGAIYVGLGKYEEALACLKMTLDLLPECIDALEYYCASLISLDRFEEAVLSLKLLQKTNVKNKKIDTILLRSYFAITNQKAQNATKTSALKDEILSLLRAG